MIIWEDVQKTLGRTLKPAQQEQADLWIGQALAIIGARATLEGTGVDQLDQAILDMIVTEAVADRFRYPDNATQVTVQVDDAQVTKRRESSTGQIEIRDEWWDLLFPNADGEAFTIRPFYVPDPPSYNYRPDGSHAWMPHHDR